MNKKQLIEEISQIEHELIEIRRALHQMPETGFNTEKTIAYIRNKLDQYGCEALPCGKSGLSVTLGQKEGKTILLRADVDALPMCEETELDYASKNGNMHACGHDFHAAMLLGAAKILKAHEHELNGNVKLMFQSAEEIFEGAKDMVEHGILEKVDAAMMIHVISCVPISSGTILISSAGVGASAADMFEIMIQGKGCHGSMPETGRDPLIPMAHLILGLQSLQTREISVSDKSVLTIGSVHAGKAANIIPDQVILKGSLRTYDEKIRSYLKQRICELSASTAAIYQCTAEVSYTSGCPTLINDKKLSSQMVSVLSEVFEDKAMMAPSGTSGSEDFAYVSQQVPSLMLSLAAGHPQNGYVYPLHHPKVMFDESALIKGTSAFVICAMEYLKS